MSNLFANSFFLRAKSLRWRSDYKGIIKLLEENKCLKNRLCDNHKFLSLLESICYYRLDQSHEQAFKGFEWALQLEIDSKVEELALNVLIYNELTVYYAEINKFEDSLKMCKIAKQELEQLKSKLDPYDYHMEQCIMELRMVVEYNSAYTYISLGNSQHAFDCIKNVMQMCQEQRTTWLLDKCYILVAMRHSRFRALNKCEKALDTAKQIVNITGNTALQPYVKNMERIVQLHKKGVWEYNGKKLVEYEHEKKIRAIAKEIQRHTVEGDIDPIFAKKKQLW